MKFGDPRNTRRVSGVLVPALVALVGLSGAGLATASNCPADIEGESRADVTANPPGYDYDVYYTTDPGDDQFSVASATDVRDSLVDSHNTLTDATRNFDPPFFNDDPQDTCIYDSANIASAPHWGIRVDAPQMDGLPEPLLRAIIGHEMFHHAEYAYINFNDWPSWGAWNVEAAARAMEDKMWLDTDINPANSLFQGEVDDYLGNPNRTLWNISYTAALFWTYLSEQLGTPFPEPGRGVDFIQRFWSLTDGESPDGTGILRDTIDTFTSKSLEELFIEFAVANYTHDLDVSALSDSSRWRYFDETLAGGGGGADGILGNGDDSTYDAVARTAVVSFNTTLADSVVRWGAKYFEVEVPTEQDCEAIGFWGKSKNGQNLGWALVGVKAGGQVTEIYRTRGSEFYRALINPPAGQYDKLALVVIGLSESADFEYAFGWGAVSGTIKEPTLDRIAFVGEKDNPERFQVRLEMLGPATLTPSGTGDVSLRGLDTTLFDVSLRSVATGNVYEADIVNASYVSGEYWMVVQAPVITNAADGDFYDLEICFCERSGACSRLLLSTKSVLYARVTLNEMLVLDTSGSMKYPTSEPKIEAAINAAALYVDAAGEDDFVGVVQFKGNDSECDDDAILEYPLSSIATDRGSIRTSLGGLGASGWTSIGDGILAGRNELFGATSVADILAIVLLSDGLQNEGDFWGDPNGACGSSPVKDSFDPALGGPAADQRIDTIAFGADADQALLQSIATFTGGDFYAVSTDVPAPRASRARAPLLSQNLQVPNRLANVYRTAEEEVAGQDRLFNAIVDIAAGGSDGLSIPITEAAEGGVIDGVFAFNWNDDGANAQVDLRDPGGTSITASTPGWVVTQDKTNKVYRYDGILDPGEWLVEVRSDTDIQFLAMLSGRLVRGVDLDVYFSQLSGELPQRFCETFPFVYLRGLPVTIIANLNDIKGGIENATVEALVENPDGSVNTLVLFDDGLHEDGLGGDGIYANRYTRTPFFSTEGVPDFPAGPPSGKWGSYNVTTSANGVNHFEEPFTRSRTSAFQVYEFESGQGECEPDMDNDDLPDRWEDLYGLDKGDPNDGFLDHDNDGLDGYREFNEGGDPFDPDTDEGGEADGSELSAGRDLVYVTDDRLAAIVDYGIVTQRTDLPVHIPEPQTNILHFPVNRAYTRMHIYRTDPAWVGFREIQSVDLALDPSGVYYDRPLTNGVNYRYYLIAEGQSGALTGPTEIFANTPKADPVPPKGWIRLNLGYNQTISETVLVQVDISDKSVEMRISESPDFAGAAWEPIKEEFSYTLTSTRAAPPFIGRLYAKFRDAAGNESIAYHDSILVDPDADNDGDGVADVNDNCTLIDNPAQTDSDGDGFGNECDADVNNDGEIEFADLNDLKLAFFSMPGDPNWNLGADLNGDGIVDFSDLNQLKLEFFGKPGPAGPVP